MIAEIVLNSSAIELGKIYDYKISDEYIGTVTIGQKVTVPFGVNNSKKEGFVVGIKEKTDVKRIKIIDEFSDDILTEEQMHIAKFIAKKYFCNLGCSMNLFCIDKVKRRPKLQTKEIKIEEDNIANLGQEQAIKYLKSRVDIGKFEEVLLHGVTGSGKTEVYLQVAKYIISLGKTLIVLVPEISVSTSSAP